MISRASGHGAAIAAVLLGAGSAWARPDRESITFNNVLSDGLLNSPTNALRSNTFAGGYALGRVRFTGTLTSVHAATWRTDSRIVVTAPGGGSTVFQPFMTGSTFTSEPVNGGAFMPPGTSPAGQWTFRFFEAFDDGSAGQADARWNITITLTDDPPAPPSAIELGTVLAPGAASVGNSITGGQIRWFRFTLAHMAHSALRTYLDADTAGSSISASGGVYLNDTDMGLYDATGALVAIDDDSGPGFTSQLTFGWGTRPAVGDGQPYNGRNGGLPAGVYYLAVGVHPVNFAPTYWGATPIGGSSGTISVNLGTNMTATPPVCYANCDASTLAPILNVNDFSCFLNLYAAGGPAANCDGSTILPVLNVNDFSCFLNAYAAGCP